MLMNAFGRATMNSPASAFAPRRRRGLLGTRYVGWIAILTFRLEVGRTLR